jgi:spore coat protein U-like protein
MGLRTFALLAFAALFARPAAAAPVSATVTVRASVVKPLTFSSLQNMDFGTIVLRPGTWAGSTVSISRTGVLTCPAATLICTGPALPAKYNVQGTNNQTVMVTAPNATLVNQSDSSKTLLLVLDKPPNFMLPNSGAPGIDFVVGGSITLSSATADGTYAGTLNVTVDYQ